MPNLQLFFIQTDPKALFSIIFYHMALEKNPQEEQKNSLVSSASGRRWSPDLQLVHWARSKAHILPPDLLNTK